MGIADSTQSTITNPQSPIPNPQSPSKISFYSTILYFKSIYYKKIKKIIIFLF